MSVATMLHSQKTFDLNFNFEKRRDRKNFP